VGGGRSLPPFSRPDGVVDAPGRRPEQADRTRNTKNSVAGGRKAPTLGAPAWYPGNTPRTEADNPADGRPGCPAGHIGALPTGGIRHDPVATGASRALQGRAARRASPLVSRPRRRRSVSGCSFWATTTSVTRSWPGPMCAATRSACLASRQTARRPTSSSFAACTSWPNRPTSSPRPTSRCCSPT